MPPKGFDCIGFAAYALGDDGRFHPVDLSQTVTLTPDTEPEIIGRVESVEIREVFEEFAGGPTSLLATVTALVDLHNGPAIRWLFGLSPKKRDARKLKRMKEKARRMRLKKRGVVKP